MISDFAVPQCGQVMTDSRSIPRAQPLSDPAAMSCLTVMPPRYIL
jgi:hypothetical protein